MTKILPLLTMLFFYINGSAQRMNIIDRSSLQVTGGINYPIASVTGIPGANLTLAYTLAPTNFMGVGMEVSAGSLHGTGDLSYVDRELGPTMNNYRFNTVYASYSFNGYLNLYKIFHRGTRPPQRWVMFATAGFGKIDVNASSQSTLAPQSRHYAYSVYTDHVGLQLRFKCSRQIDFIHETRFTRTGSGFLDALPQDIKKDNFLSFQFGVSYHFGLYKKGRSVYIDWRNICKYPCQRRMGDWSARY